MFVEIVRLFMVLLGSLAGYAGGHLLDASSAGSMGTASGGAMLGCLIGYVGGGVFGRLLERAVGLVERSADRMSAPQFLAAVVGGGIGSAAGAVLAAPVVVLVPSALGWPLGGLLVFVSFWVGLRVAVRKTEELLAIAGLSTRPLVRSTPYGASDGFVVDTSAIMDGQLLALARAGFVDGGLLVPRFVLDELRGLADVADSTRARRARAGLEALDALRAEGTVRLCVLDDEMPEFTEVDAKVVALARRLELRLLTTDAHLAHSAGIQGVPVSNLRQVAAELWPTRTPGEVLGVEVVRPGREPGQGVGYLDDGSMVVVAGGADLVGRGEVSVSVTAVVPTAVGRVVFAHPA